MLGALIKSEPPPPSSPWIVKYKNAVTSLQNTFRIDCLTERIDSYILQLQNLKKLREELKVSSDVCNQIEITILGKSADHLAAEIKLNQKMTADKTKALSVYQKALSLFKRSSDSTDADQIINDCDIAIAFYPQLYVAIYLKALALGNKKKYSLAIQTISEYIEYAGLSKTALFRRGLLRLATEQALSARDAAADFSEALKISNNDNLAGLDLKHNPDDMLLLMYRSYAFYAGNLIDESKTDLELLIQQVLGAENFPNNIPSATLLQAILCKTAIQKKDPGVLSIFENIIKSSNSKVNSFGQALGDLETKLNGFKLWKLWFSELETASQFRDRMKLWLVEATKYLDPSNIRNQIQLFFNTIGWENGENHWLLSTGEWIDSDDTILLRVASVIAEKGGRFRETASDTLVSMWRQNPKMPFSTVALDPLVQPIFEK